MKVTVALVVIALSLQANCEMFSFGIYPQQREYERNFDKLASLHRYWDPFRKQSVFAYEDLINPFSIRKSEKHNLQRDEAVSKLDEWEQAQYDVWEKAFEERKLAFDECERLAREQHIAGVTSEKSRLLRLGENMRNQNEPNKHRDSHAFDTTERQLEETRQRVYELKRLREEYERSREHEKQKQEERQRHEADRSRQFEKQKKLETDEREFKRVLDELQLEHKKLKQWVREITLETQMDKRPKASVGRKFEQERDQELLRLQEEYEKLKQLEDEEQKNNERKKYEEQRQKRLLQEKLEQEKRDLQRQMEELEREEYELNLWLEENFKNEYTQEKNKGKQAEEEAQRHEEIQQKQEIKRLQQEIERKKQEQLHRRQQEEERRRMAAEHKKRVEQREQEERQRKNEELKREQEQINRERHQNKQTVSSSTPETKQIATLNIPGHTSKDISVKTVNDFILVKGFQKSKDDLRRLVQTFYKSIPIPPGIDAKSIRATVDTKGILEITGKYQPQTDNDIDCDEGPLIEEMAEDKYPNNSRKPRTSYFSPNSSHRQYDTEYCDDDVTIDVEM